MSLVLVLGIEGRKEIEDPTFGPPVPRVLWQQNSHIVLRKRLHHLTPERCEMFTWQHPRVFGKAPRLTT